MPGGFDVNAFPDANFDPAGFEKEDFEPPDWIGVGFMGGWAVDALGVMGSLFLADGVGVPAGAQFLGGIAHSQAGRRYVCPWPASNKVHYRGQVAVREDGAMCIATAGVAVPGQVWALTARGEVLATDSQAVQRVVDGVGLRDNGFVVLENAD